MEVPPASGTFGTNHGRPKPTMNNPGARMGLLLLLLGWMVFVFAIVPFVYGINQFRTFSLTLALAGAVVMISGGVWAWRAGVLPGRPPRLSSGGANAGRP